MNDFFNKPISRRDFLKLNLAGFAALVAFRPLSGPVFQQFGRAAAQITGSGINPQSQTSSTSLVSSRIYSPLTLLAANRLTFGARQEDMDWIETNGLDAFVDEQLAFEKIDDSGVQPRLLGLTTLSLTAGSLLPANVGDALLQLQQAAVLRAVYSKRQLFELMVDFWTNHFRIYLSSNSDYILKTVDDRDVIRKYALGSFRDLLGGSAHSPAMLLSFDVNESLIQNPNEHYARELLELQTIGINGGYTEKDVTEIARAFTGWSVVSQVHGKPSIGSFKFVAANHDEASKTILGHRLPAFGDEKDGEQIFDILAGMPASAAFISLKLAQRFVADNPPASVVQLGAGVFQSTHGDIRATLAAILHSQEFKNSSGLKMKRPFEYVVSALRVLNAETDAGSSLQSYLQKMGQPLFLRDEPGSYPDSLDAWMNAGELLTRWNFAKALADNSIKGTHVDLTPWTMQPGDTVAEFAQAVLARTIPTEDVAALQPLADAKKISELAAVLIGSPLFQLRS